MMKRKKLIIFLIVISILMTACASDMTEEDILQAVDPVVDVTDADDFLVGYWASIGEYSFGMAQPGLPVWFDGEHGCFYSPYDTYWLEPDGDHYMLFCTNYLWGDTLDFRVDILDENNVAINFRNSSQSTYLTRTDENGNYLGKPYSGDMSGNAFTGPYTNLTDIAEKTSTGITAVTEGISELTGGLSDVTGGLSDVTGMLEDYSQTGDFVQSEEVQTELRQMDIHDFSGELSDLPEALTNGKSSSDYNPKLAYLLIALCNDVYNKKAIIQDFNDMGFTQNVQEGYTPSSGISYSIGKKYLDDGTEELLVVIKGTENTREIIKDLNLGMGAFGIPHWHEGFSGASRDVYDTIEQFADDPKSARIYITGFSLGAATANLLSVRLSDNGASKDNIYDYNFACPDVAVGLVTEWNKHGVHDNMFNLGHCKDAITVLPGTACDMAQDNLINQWGKFGRSYWYSNDWGSSEETGVDLAVLNFTYHNQWKYLDRFSRNQDRGRDDFKEYGDWKVQDAKNNIGDFFSFSWLGFGAHCPVDMIVRDSSGKEVAAVIGGEAEYYDSEPGNVIIFTNGEEKAILVAGDDMQAEIIGTGEGTMDFYVWKGDTGHREILSSYEEVEVSTGRILHCDVTEEKDKAEITLAEVDESGRVITEIKPDHRAKSGLTWWKIVIIVVVAIAVAIGGFLAIDSLLYSLRRKKKGGHSAGKKKSSRSSRKKTTSRSRSKSRRR